MIHRPIATLIKVRSISIILNFGKKDTMIKLKIIYLLNQSQKAKSIYFIIILSDFDLDYGV